jgi:rhamnose utilization protein RhaD (predicted bifunctional aldolase and dehydrogenase)
MKKNKEKISSQISNFCQKIGKNKLLVQGGGGNVSWKQNSTLWIKASGTSLSQAKKKNIFTPVNLQKLQKSIKLGNFFQKPVMRYGNLIPSIETYMHAVIPHKIVVHLHAIDFLSFLINKNAKICLKKKLCEYDHTFLDYVKPGGDLAKLIYKKNIKYKKINLILLKNHGIIISSDDLRLIDFFLHKIIKKIRTKNLPKLKSKKYKVKKIKGYKFCSSKKIQNIVLNKNIFTNLKKNWAICPDHINYLGIRPFVFEKFNSFLLSSKTSAPYLFFKDSGVYERITNTKNHHDQLIAYYDTMIRQSDFNFIDTLNHKQINDIIFWGIEIYRRHLND